jgi:hypothetical protein
VCVFFTLTASLHGETSATRSTTSTKQTLIPPARRDVPGRHLPLTSGTLFVPQFFDAGRTTCTEAVVLFHGAAWVAEQNFYDAHKNAVLISVSLPMDKYASAFEQTGALERILLDAESKLTDFDITSAPICKLCISSFSGGYGAVREILRNGARHEQISDVVLADSLYGPRRPGSDTELATSATQPFLDFAREAASGHKGKRFFFSQLFPPEEKYRTNTTTVAAYYLTDALNVERVPAHEKTIRGTPILYKAEKGAFHVYGYAGMTTQDHFDHYYGISELWKRTSLTDAGK